MRVEAALLPSRGAELVVAELELGPPGPGEICVAIAAAGICHADSLAKYGDLPFPAPGVLGHEGAGVVAELGPETSGLAVGDHVVLGMPWCGHCRRCLAGQPRYCDHVLELITRGSRADGSTSLSRPDGSPVHSHFFGQSSFATHCVVAARQAVRVSKVLPLAQLGPLGCGISTGAGAVLNVLRPEIGSSLVVFGVGTVGLAAVMAARSSGATTIVAVDRYPQRLAAARRLGATETVEADGTRDLLGAIREACDGPADYSLECTGNMEVLRTAVDCIGMLGVCGLVGGARAGAELTLDHHSTLIGKRVVGIHGGEGTSGDLVGGLLALSGAGRFPFGDLVETFPLAEINEAIAAGDDGRVIKAVVEMPA